VWALRLGKIGGIVVEVHLTFALTLLWGGWQGWMQYGDVGGAAYGVLMILLLFACVLAHEFAHARAAQASGLTVQRVTLLPIGGVAQVVDTPPTPRDELRITLAGPVANLALAIPIGMVVTLVAGGLSGPRSLDALIRLSQLRPSLLGMAVYLLGANLGLFMFNMLPAFPMDGGRVLRAALALAMDYERATRFAAGLGRLVAIGLIVVGVVGLPLHNVPPNPLLILAALIVFTGARQEEIYVRARRALVHMEVVDVYREPKWQVTPSDALTPGLVNDLYRHQMVLPVVSEGRLVGILTPNDLRGVMQRPSPVSVAHVMQTHYPTLKMHDTLLVAMQIMEEHKLSSAPVVDDGMFHGMIALEDIHRAWRLSPRRRQSTRLKSRR
jgi:Zn-dependent protease/predicted transcriptional regulator